MVANDVKTYRPFRSYKDRVFGLEKASEAWDELMGLAHWEWVEVGDRDRFGEFIPDLDRVKVYEHAGSLLLFTIRTKPDMRMIGYYLCSVSHNLKQQGRRSVNEVGVYIHPEYRDGYTIRMLLKYVEDTLRELKVHELVVSHRPDSPRVGTLYERMGYTPVCISYRKVLNPLSEASDAAA